LPVKTCSLVNEKTIEDGTLDLLLHMPNISINRDTTATNIDMVKFLSIRWQCLILIFTFFSYPHVTNLVINPCFIL